MRTFIPTILLSAALLPLVTPANHYTDNSFAKRQSAALPAYVPSTNISATLPCGVVNVTGLNSPSLGVASFLAIPYAIPPVGDLRFKAPQEFVYTEGKNYDGRYHGPACLQANVSANTGGYGTSESCLTLDVFAPSTAVPAAHYGGSTSTGNKTLLPVMVWIYGGAFDEGASNLYNASAIIYESVQIQSPIIVVALNYRLGIFGFGQGSEFATNNATNLGLRDQILALEWVQTNIASFGGDPRKVTLAGESAGAISIALHYLNPALVHDTLTSNTLFRSAIMESGAQYTYPITNEFTTRQNVFDTFVNLTNCSTGAMGTMGTASYNQSLFSCLKALPAATLLAAQNQILAMPLLG